MLFEQVATTSRCRILAILFTNFIVISNIFFYFHDLIRILFNNSLSFDSFFFDFDNFVLYFLFSSFYFFYVFYTLMHVALSENIIRFASENLINRLIKLLHYYVYDYLAV